MRYVENQFAQIRRFTDTRNATATSGMSTEELIFYINDAQRDLQDGILIENPDVTLFDSRYSIAPVVGQQAYTLDATVSWNHSVRKLQYSYSGNARDYYELDKLFSLDQVSEVQGSRPCGYYLEGSSVYITPVPSSSGGAFRLVAPRRLDSLDIRRGQVASTANDGTNYTTITIESNSVLNDSETLNSLALGSAEYVCVVDKDGASKYRNVGISSWNSGTRVLTLDSGVALSGGTISAGDYVVIGTYTTTHSGLPIEAEPELLSWVQWKILRREEKVSAAEEQQELARHVSRITRRLGLDLDVMRVPHGDW